MPPSATHSTPGASASTVATVAAPASASTRLPVVTPRRRVTDVFTRTLHWLFALCLVGAYLTADSERWRLHHVVLGYTMAGLLVVRLWESWRGPRQASLRALWGRLSGAPAFLRSLWGWAALHSPASTVAWRQGQNLLLAACMVGLLALVPWVTLSGVLGFHELGGAWQDATSEWHDTLGEAMLWLALAHVGGMAALSAWRQDNLADPMLTGTIKGRGPDLVKTPRSGRAAALALLVLGYWIGEWGVAALR